MQVLLHSRDAGVADEHAAGGVISRVISGLRLLYF